MPVVKCYKPSQRWMPLTDLISHTPFETHKCIDATNSMAKRKWPTQDASWGVWACACLVIYLPEAVPAPNVLQIAVGRHFGFASAARNDGGCLSNCRNKQKSYRHTSLTFDLRRQINQFIQSLLFMHMPLRLIQTTETNNTQLEMPLNSLRSKYIPFLFCQSPACDLVWVNTSRPLQLRRLAE